MSARPWALVSSYDGVHAWVLVLNHDGDRPRALVLKDTMASTVGLVLSHDGGLRNLTIQVNS